AIEATIFAAPLHKGGRESVAGQGVNDTAAECLPMGRRRCIAMSRRLLFRLIRHSSMVLTLGTAMSACAPRVVSVEEVDKMIRDEVPIGSDRQTVKGFIDNLKVDSLQIGREEFHQADRQALGNRDPQKVAELGDRIAEFTGAVIYDAQSRFLNYNHIVIQFYLDRGGRMIAYTVKVVGDE